MEDFSLKRNKNKFKNNPNLYIFTTIPLLLSRVCLIFLQNKCLVIVFFGYYNIFLWEQTNL